MSLVTIYYSSSNFSAKYAHRSIIYSSFSFNSRSSSKSTCTFSKSLPAAVISAVILESRCSIFHISFNLFPFFRFQRMLVSSFSFQVVFGQVGYQLLFLPPQLLPVSLLKTQNSFHNRIEYRIFS